MARRRKRKEKEDDSTPNDDDPKSDLDAVVDEVESVSSDIVGDDIETQDPKTTMSDDEREEALKASAEMVVIKVITYNHGYGYCYTCGYNL